MKCSCQRIGIVVLNSAWMRGYGSHVCVCCGGGGLYFGSWLVVQCKITRICEVDHFSDPHHM
jgi:membrane protein YqaA with SNARE-associated domain